MSVYFPLITLNLCSVLGMIFYLVRRYVGPRNLQADNSYIIIFILSGLFIVASLNLTLNRNTFKWSDDLKAIVHNKGSGNKFSSVSFVLLSYLMSISALALVVFKSIADFNWH